MCINGSIFTIVKPAVTNTLRDIDKLLAALQAIQGLPVSLLPEECAVLISFIQGLTAQKAALESTLEGMKEKIEEGIRKGWQLEELKRMLFGKKSERYTDYSSDIATQPSLGVVFDSEDIEGVIAASRARTAEEKELRDQQRGQPKTNRQKGKEPGYTPWNKSSQRKYDCIFPRTFLRRMSPRHNII
jgi:hypothetical protein